MFKMINEELKYFIKQNKLELVDVRTDGNLIVKIHGHEYLLYSDVTCSKCGAPLMCINAVDEDEPDYIPWSGCSNIFCKDRI